MVQHNAWWGGVRGKDTHTEGEQPPWCDVRATRGVAVDLGMPLSRGGPRGARSVEGGGNNHNGHKGRPVRPTGRGPTLPWAGAASGGTWRLRVEPRAPCEPSRA